MNARATPAMVGVDLDNTIVSYDELFYAIAVERGLVPETCRATKEAVRDQLRAKGREEEWTQLQGYVYGPAMPQAEPFPGAVGFLERCAAASISTAIISHRTRWPYSGPRHDLHASARNWLESHGIQTRVHLELSREAKMARIATAGCTHFIDDLPDFLVDPAFPPGVTRLLFDPHAGATNGDPLPPSVQRFDDWDRIAAAVIDA